MAFAAADDKRIQAIGKASGLAQQLHRLLQGQPLSSIAAAGTRLNLTLPTVVASLKHLDKLGIVRETVGSSRRHIPTRFAGRRPGERELVQVAVGDMGPDVDTQPAQHRRPELETVPRAARNRQTREE